VNQQMKLRGSVAYEQSAGLDAFRTPGLPDNDHTILAAGLNFQLSPTTSVDVAYHHGFVKRAPVNTAVAGAGTLLGNYKVSADVVSVQYNHGF
jgi:long-subunit fatty acid transport protein